MSNHKVMLKEHLELGTLREAMTHAELDKGKQQVTLTLHQDVFHGILRGGTVASKPLNCSQLPRQVINGTGESM